MINMNYVNVCNPHGILRCINTTRMTPFFNIYTMYTASKAKHQRKNVKFSKYEFILVIYMKLYKLVTIYSKFLFDKYSTLTTRHDKCTLSTKKVPNHANHRPILAFLYHYETKIIKVILLQNQIYDMSVNFRKIYMYLTCLIEQKI